MSSPFKRTVDKMLETLIYISPLEGAMQLKQAPLDLYFRVLEGGILFSKLFSDSQNQNMGPGFIVHGFRSKTEDFDSGKKGYHRIVHLKRSRMTQISAS